MSGHHVWFRLAAPRAADHSIALGGRSHLQRARVEAARAEVSSSSGGTSDGNFRTTSVCDAAFAIALSRCEPREVHPGVEATIVGALVLHNSAPHDPPPLLEQRAVQRLRPLGHVAAYGDESSQRPYREITTSVGSNRYVQRAVATMRRTRKRCRNECMQKNWTNMLFATGDASSVNAQRIIITLTRGASSCRSPIWRRTLDLRNGTGMQNSVHRIAQGGRSTNSGRSGALSSTGGVPTSIMCMLTKTLVRMFATSSGSSRSVPKIGESRFVQTVLERERLATSSGGRRSMPRNGRRSFMQSIIMKSLSEMVKMNIGNHSRRGGARTVMQMNFGVFGACSVSHSGRQDSMNVLMQRFSRMAILTGSNF